MTVSSRHKCAEGVCLSVVAPPISRLASACVLDQVPFQNVGAYVADSVRTDPRSEKLHLLDMQYATLLQAGQRALRGFR